MLEAGKKIEIKTGGLGCQSGKRIETKNVLLFIGKIEIVVSSVVLNFS